MFKLDPSEGGIVFILTPQQKISYMQAYTLFTLIVGSYSHPTIIQVSEICIGTIFKFPDCKYLYIYTWNIKLNFVLKAY